MAATYTPLATPETDPVAGAAVTAEQLRALAAEGVLGSSLAALAAVGATDAELAAAVSVESVRALAAEGVLTGNLAAVVAAGATDAELAPVAVTAAAAWALAQAVESAQVDLAAAAALPALLSARTLTGLGNSPYWLKVVGTKLYVLLTNDSRVRAYDITAPGAPVYLGQTAVLGPAPAGIEAYGTTLYVTDQGDVTLRVIDASNPAAMTVVGTLVYSTGTGGGRCAVNGTGTHLLIGGPESGADDDKAILVNVTTPASPAVLGRVTTGATHRGVAFLGSAKWALASRDDHTVKIIDTSTPATPTVIASITTPGTVTTPLAIDGTTLYVGDYGGGGLLSAYNVSTPAAPALLGSVAIGSGCEQIAVHDDRAFIGLRASNAGALVDITDPADMELLYTLAPGGTVTPGAALVDGYAYLTIAGDTTNGKLAVFAVEPVVAVAASALQGQVESVDAAKANLAGANALTGTQTLASATPLVLSNAAASVTIGGYALTLATNLLRWAQVFIAKQLLVYVTSAGDTALGVKAELSGVLDAQNRFAIDGIGDIRWGSGAAAADVRLSRGGAGLLSVLTADLLVSTVGKGMRIKEGSNAKMGTATLVGGTVTVANTSVTANSRIQLTVQSLGTVTAPKAVAVTARTAGTSFTITSADATDTSVVAYELVEPA